MAQALHQRADRRQQRRRHAQVQLVALRHEAALQPAAQRLPLVRPAQRAPQLQAVDASTPGRRAAPGSRSRRRCRRAAGRPGAGCGSASSRARARRGLLAQRARVHAVALHEGGIEAAQAGIAAGQRHLRHRQVGVGEQLLGQQQALRAQVVRSASRHAPAEDAAQVAVGHAQPLRRCRGRYGSSPPRAACSISRAACRASTCDESASDSPGDSSGRQRRQGRKPSRSALAALAKKRQLRRSGVRTRHTGRQ